MAISGEKMIDVLDTLQQFIDEKLLTITECKMTPAEVAFALHHLAWVYHQKCEFAIEAKLGKPR